MKSNGKDKRSVHFGQIACKIIRTTGITEIIGILRILRILRIVRIVRMHWFHPSRNQTQATTKRCIWDSRNGNLMVRQKAFSLRIWIVRIVKSRQHPSRHRKRSYQMFANRFNQRRFLVRHFLHRGNNCWLLPARNLFSCHLGKWSKDSNLTNFERTSTRSIEPFNQSKLSALLNCLSW
jgi:hypothetical protein